MLAVKVIRALLVGDAAVLALAPEARIFVGIVPQGVPLPALAIRHISTADVPPISATPVDNVLRSRIEVEVLAASYPAQEHLLDAVGRACNYQRGVIAGTRVISILRDGVGADDFGDEPDQALFSKTVDWLVTHYEA